MSESEFEGAQGGDEIALAAAWTAEEPDDAEASDELPLVDSDQLDSSIRIDESELEAEPWEGVSRDEWEATQEQINYQADLIHQAQQEVEAQQAAAERDARIEAFLGDPWSDGYEQRLFELQQAQLAVGLERRMQEEIDARVSPLAETLEEQQIEDARFNAYDVIDESFAPYGVTLTDETRAELLEFANEAFPAHLEAMYAQGVSAESAEYEAARAVLAGLGPYFAAQVEAQRPGDELDLARRYTDAGQAAPHPPMLRDIVRSTLGEGPFDGSWVRPLEVNRV